MENMQAEKRKFNKTQRLVEGASKAVRTTKPAHNTIVEHNDIDRNRIKKLAGIK